jgi:hypothetical protein
MLCLLERMPAFRDLESEIRKANDAKKEFGSLLKI